MKGTISSQIEDATLTQIFEYSFKAKQYDTSTFAGRFSHFNTVTDPRNFFVTQTKLNQSIEMVKHFRAEEDRSGRPLLLSKHEYD